jgi:L-threonylcarbamoyladenylate synthase
VSRVYRVDPSRPETAGDSVLVAAAALRAGRLVVVPTETVYGLACRPDDPHATRRIFEVKRRPAGLSLPVLAASAEDALALARPGDLAARLAARFWPGPLTLVLPRSERSRPWSLGEQPRTIAIRVPDHPVARALLAEAGPLAATSANISGRALLEDPDAIQEAFGDSVAVYLFVPGSTAPSEARASTVVDMTRPEGPMILRQGPIAERELSSLLGPAQTVGPGPTG